MSPPLWLEDCISLPASVRIDDQRLCFLYGLITYRDVFAWRFTTTDLFDPVREFHAKFTPVFKKTINGCRSREDMISLPRDLPNGWTEQQAISRILAELLIAAFNRSETAFTPFELDGAYVESQPASFNATATAKIWFNPRFVAKRRHTP